MKELATIVIQLTERNAQLISEYEKNNYEGESRAHLFGQIAGINTALDAIQKVLAIQYV